MNEQINMFDILYDSFKIDKPIKLIEMFAGYGSQAFALKYLGVPFEHHKICEWAIPSIQAYKDGHCANDNRDYSKDLNTNEIYNYLYNKGVSSNYNEPMKLDQIKRLGESTARNIYNNILSTNNLVNIQQVKGNDLDIIDKDKYCYILTYSFPCQDLSLAGLCKGMSRDGGTRSGMLWEVERILDECNEINSLPQVLLMENVPQVIGINAISDFQEWRAKLESLGYSNYVEILNAKDYGIPQNRERCFMVSILGDYNYNFPKKIPLEKKLKDILEDNVDEKYYLSDKQLDYVLDMQNTALNSGRDINDRIVNPNIAKTISCRGAVDQRADVTNFTIDECEEEIKVKDLKLRIKNATQKGYLEAYEGDGIDISGRMQYHRGTVQKQIAQTLKTTNDVGVVVKDDTPLKRELCNMLIANGECEEGDVIKHSYTQQILDGKKKCVEKSDGVMITLTTRGDCVGVCVKDDIGVYDFSSSDNFCGGKRDLGKQDVMPTLLTQPKKAIYKSDLRIRKLTPRECGRLMSVKNEDISNIMKNQSNSKAYHLFGDSICCNVLMGIFGEMLDVDWLEKVRRMLNELKD